MYPTLHRPAAVGVSWESCRVEAGGHGSSDTHAGGLPPAGLASGCGQASSTGAFSGQEGGPGAGHPDGCARGHSTCPPTEPAVASGAVGCTDAQGVSVPHVAWWPEVMSTGGGEASIAQKLTVLVAGARCGQRERAGAQSPGLGHGRGQVSAAETKPLGTPPASAAISEFQSWSAPS